MPRRSSHYFRNRRQKRLRLSSIGEDVSPGANWSVLAAAWLIGVCIAIVELTHIANRVSFPQTNLPAITARPFDRSEFDLVIAVTTTDAAGREPGPEHAGASLSGQCRVFLDSGLAVNSDELYDRAFEKLEAAFFDPIHPWRYQEGAQEIEIAPTAYIRADGRVPWQCVAGATYIIQAAGWPRIGFMTRPID